MDALGAVKWVEENRLVIEKWLCNKLKFTPYDMEDYYNDAVKAALIAANKIASGEAGESPEFCKIFWETFKEEVAAVTPYPINDDAVLSEVFTKAVENGHSEEEARNLAAKRLETMRNTERRRRSVSLPNTYQSVVSEEGFDILSNYSRYKEKATIEFDVDAAIAAVGLHLKPMERQVLELTFGLGDGGRLTQVEIGKRLGREHRTIRNTQNRIFEKINKARNAGLLNPDDFTRWRDPYEAELRLAS